MSGPWPSSWSLSMLLGRSNEVVNVVFSNEGCTVVVVLLLETPPSSISLFD